LGNHVGVARKNGNPRSEHAGRDAFDAAIAKKPAGPVHDPESDAHREAAPGRRLVSCNRAA
jgi:hypothetical protein